MTRELENLLNQLDEKERKQALATNVDSVQKLIPLLLRRVSISNAQEVVSLLKKSIIPSICSEIDCHLENLFTQIEQNPQLLFKNDIQYKIGQFIAKRFERDRKVVSKKTSDISKIVVMMGEYINDTIEKNGIESENIRKIKEQILKINIEEDGIESLTHLQKELANAASLITEEISNTNSHLKSEKSRVEELEEKIKILENELSKSKNENMKDHLTGIFTRKAYEEAIKNIEDTFKRGGTNFALVFFDLDYFKKINDSYGHKCGDTILMTFGKVLSKYTRNFDIVSRYGGEEFVAVVHFNEEKEIINYLKRIKNIVTNNSFLFENRKIKVTFSAGVAMRKNYKSYEETIKFADSLLYEAKNSGRNRIILDNKIVL